jgi:inosose dehydratase
MCGAADRAAQHGLTGTFHPHVDCHVETEEEIERLLADTDVQLWNRICSR